MKLVNQVVIKCTRKAILDYITRMNQCIL